MINKTAEGESSIPVDTLFKNKEKKIGEDRELFGFVKKGFNAVKRGVTAGLNAMGIRTSNRGIFNGK